MSRKTSRTSPTQQLPGNRPAYLNDSTGFWEKTLKVCKAGWETILPGVIHRTDLNQVARDLQAMIDRSPVEVKWIDGNVKFTAALDDGQSSSPLELGGIGATGAVTIIFSKSWFALDNWPAPKSELQLQVRDKWKTFQIISISEGFNMYDDALVAVLEPEDSQ